MNTSIFGEIVDNKLVHKTFRENVFVANIRRGLPVRLFEHEYQQLCESMSTEEKRIFEFGYLPAQSDFDSLAPEKQENFRIIRDCPECIPIEMVKNSFQQNSLRKQDLYFVRKFYRKDSQKGFYKIKKIMTESDIFQLRRILDFNYYFLTESEKTVISEYLDKCQINCKNNSFYGSMIIDTSHKFFFEHKIDHIPGMMLMEALRQFLLAVCHKYGNVPLDYHFILSKISIEFDDYLELNLPVVIKAEIKDLKKYSDGIWSGVSFEVHVLQDGETCSISEFKGAMIKKQVFQRVRKKRKHALVKHPWFVLKETLRYKFIVKTFTLKIPLEILFISEIGIIGRIDKKSEASKLDGKVEFFAYFEDIALISGMANVSILSENQDYAQIQFTFLDMHQEDTRQLRMIIEFYGFLSEDIPVKLMRYQRVENA